MYVMLRQRVLKHWAQVVGVNVSQIKVPDEMHDILSHDTELTIADMKKWVLRECDVSEYKYWMPHRIVNGRGFVRVYYVWVGSSHMPEYKIVLVIGAGRAEIHKWTGDNVEITPAKVEEKPTAKRPDIAESLQISEYLSKFNQKEPSMTIDGVKVAGLKK